MSSSNGYCPCNGKCHEDKYPCSFSCISHHKSDIKVKVNKLNKYQKGILDLFIYNILEAKDIQEVRDICNTWIKANGLHPEKVEIFDGTIEEFLNTKWDNIIDICK